MTSDAFDAASIAERIAASDLGRVVARVAGPAVEVQRDEALVVIVSVQSLESGALHPYTERFSMGHVGVLLVGPPPEAMLARLPSRAVVSTLHALDAPHALTMTIDGVLERVELRLAAERRSRSIRRYRYELSELVEIARAITQERDIDRLLDLILEKISDRHSREHLLFEAEQTRRLVLEDVVEIGYNNPGRWRYIADVYASLGMLPPNLDLDGFIYDQNPAPNLTRFYATTGLSLLIGLVITAVAVRYYRLSGRLQSEIAERQRVEANLDHRENELKVLMSNLPGMAYRCFNERDWPMEFVSHGCRALTGYEASDLVGKQKMPYGDVIHPDDREQVWRDVQSAIAEDRPFRITYRIITASGAERWVWEQGLKIEAETGRPRIEGFITDITDLKEAEQERETLITQLRSALDEIDALRGIIPICSGCKRIRDDQGYWNHIETYISERSGVDFSHGICPECRDKLYGDMDDD